MTWHTYIAKWCVVQIFWFFLYSFVLSFLISKMEKIIVPTSNSSYKFINAYFSTRHTELGARLMVDVIYASPCPVSPGRHWQVRRAHGKRRVGGRWRRHSSLLPITRRQSRWPAGIFKGQQRSARGGLDAELGVPRWPLALTSIWHTCLVSVSNVTGV